MLKYLVNGSSGCIFYISWMNFLPGTVHVHCITIYILYLSEKAREYLFAL